MKIIARIKTDFPEKFGIPRQSGLVESEATIIFEPEYRVDEALRGIEGFSHLWIIWEFSKVKREGWSPTVRPPRLGGNKRIGVFATRSPYRPNPIGLSSVKLIRCEKTSAGTVLIVSGADLLDGTPIYDIKPYLPISDCHTDAVGGFSDERKDYSLKVECDEKLLSIIPHKKIESLMKILSQDPRPQYIDDADRVYGMRYGEFEVKFSVLDDTLKVKSIEKF